MKIGTGCELDVDAVRWTRLLAATIPSHAMSVAEASLRSRCARVDYGLDAPGIVVTFAALCACLTIAGVVLLTRMPRARAH